METFRFVVSTRYGEREQKTFQSDNVFRDVAKNIMNIDRTKYPRGCTIAVYDKKEEKEEFWLVNKSDGTQFVRYGNCYNSSFRNRIDWNIEPKYLTCLDEDTNEYKYYQMTFDEQTAQCQVQYGRMGCKAGEFQYDKGKQSKDGSFSYPAQMFWIKYYEKIGKGYTDHTEEKDFSSSIIKSKEEYLPIKEPLSQEVFARLIQKQRDAVYEKYDMQIPSSMVAIEKATNTLYAIEQLSNDATKRAEIVSLYKELVTILPRKITNISEYIRRFSFDKESDNFIEKILEEERELLQNFAEVYKADHGKDATKETSKKVTVLEANGLNCFLPTFEELFQVEDLLQENVAYASKVLGVQNQETTKRYQDFVKENKIDKKDCHLFFHGSRTENWWSICKRGLSLNPNAIQTGKMFGQGLYFAPLARKSLGYTDFRGSYWAKGNNTLGYMALFDVAMGKYYEPTHAISSSFTKKNLKIGYHSVWAYPKKCGLRNEECIVYDEAQCNMHYLVELDASRKDLNYNRTSARETVFRNVHYDAEKDLFTAEADIGRFLVGRQIWYSVTFDGSKRTLLSPDVRALQSQESQAYLGRVFQSKFAKSEADFDVWKQGLQGKKIVPLRSVKKQAERA